MHIQISEVRVSPDEVTARRQRIAARLDNLDLIDASQGKVAAPTEDELLGYRLTVGGVELPVPITGYEAISTEDGPAVTVTIPASRISIGDPASGKPETTAQPLRVWGQADLPDPRENIPGWEPESLGEQVAANAEARAHDHTLERWTCGCDPVLVGIQDAAAKTGNIELSMVSINPARDYLEESLRTAMRRNGTVGL
jgi:hypothetical protein